MERSREVPGDCAGLHVRSDSRDTQGLSRLRPPIGLPIIITSLCHSVGQISSGRQATAGNVLEVSAMIQNAGVELRSSFEPLRSYLNCDRIIAGADQSPDPKGREKRKDLLK